MMKIDELNLSVRTYNCLRRARIDTVEQLTRMTDDDLLRLRNFGTKCLAEVREKIAKPRNTNADRIRAMSNEELADFLTGIEYAGEAPWCMPFSRKFCDHCPTIEGTVNETGQTLDFHECEFADGKCPHGSDAVWWLQQPAEEE